MTLLIILLCLILLGIVVVQIGKVSELSARIRGEEVAQRESNKWNANGMLLFGVFFLIAVVWSALHYKNDMLGYGPWVAASEHGSALDSMFNTTLIFTGIVFFITHIALFYYSWKYRGRKGHVAKFVSHNNNLELIWTAIPAVVMTFLVIRGLDAWNTVMADVDDGEEYIEVEATGYQFGWILRYPGQDGKLGERNYKLISATNPLGQDWSDRKNLDDFHPGELVLPKGKKVRVRITSRDVLHNFYLPHFRVKMDAVPGMPTYFVLTPKYTTEEYRQMLGVMKADGTPKYPEWHEIDENDPEGRKRYEAFDYELACAELCGRGHYSMRKLVKVVTPEQYEEWVASQQSWYMTSVRNSEDDPYQGQLFAAEIEAQNKAFREKVEEARAKDNAEDRVVELENISFQTGSAELTPMSNFQLDALIDILEEYPEMKIMIEGHTDNTGEPEMNEALSKNRAATVYNYLIEGGVAASRLNSVGYGETRPIESNDTEEGRNKNRRVQFRIQSL